MKWIIIFLAVLNFGFMVFDGTKAMLTGHYITPSSGPHQGQLGPWSKLAKAAGINPEGNVMRTIFVVWGLLGLFITYYYFKDPVNNWKLMLAINIMSLWYAVVGTISSVIQIILLILIKVL